MIVETSLIDRLTNRTLNKVSPSEARVRNVVWEVLAEFENEGICPHRLSLWEETKVVSEATKRLKKSQI
jgi:hypothetical protein